MVPSGMAQMHESQCHKDNQEIFGVVKTGVVKYINEAL